MNSDDLILRQNAFGGLTNKGSDLTGDDHDNNLFDIYQDLQSLAITNGVLAYNVGTTYDNITFSNATFGGRLWQWINGSSGSGVSPVEGAFWTEVFPSTLSHKKNQDTILDEGGANEISAAAIVAGLALADATTDLGISAHNSSNLTLTSSTGANVLVPQATQALAGLITAADKIQIDLTTGENTGDQSLFSLGAEDVLNKATDFLTLNDTLYPSVNAVENRIQGALSGGVNLGTADLTQSAIGTRKYTLAGSLITDLVKFENSASAELFTIRGDKSVILPDGYLGVNISTVGSGFGGHRFTVVNDSSSNGVYVQQTGGNGKAVVVTLTANTGSNVFGYHCSSGNATAITKIGALLDITGSSTANVAIDFINGDMRFGTGTGSMIGTATGEKFSFWGSSPVVQQVLATGGGATVDNVISLLQTLGLCKQS
jgi:hypothetical protein